MNRRWSLANIASLFSVACALVCSFQAQAATSSPPSSQGRQDLHVTFNAEAGLYSLGFGSGASAGVFLDDSMVLRATLRSASSCGGSGCAESLDQAALTVQYFTGNSFFVEGGFAKSTYVNHPIASEHEDGSGRKYHFKYSTESKDIVLAVGNQWQWRHFTLGCRWIGFDGPISSQTSVRSDSDGYVVGPEEEKSKKSQSGLVAFLPALILAGAFSANLPLAPASVAVPTGRSRCQLWRTIRAKTSRNMQVQAVGESALEVRAVTNQSIEKSCPTLENCGRPARRLYSDRAGCAGSRILRRQ